MVLMPRTDSHDLISQPESAHEPVPNAYTASDVALVLRECGHLPRANTETPENGRVEDWCRRAADLLGPHSPDRDALVSLLSLVFDYDAGALLQKPENQAVMLRKGSREVIRALAHLVLDGANIDPQRFQEVIEGIRAAVPYRSRSLFQPVRLALAGRAGDGDLDRVILLLDGAAGLPFMPRVKGTRQRMLEFCAALD